MKRILNRVIILLLPTIVVPSKLGPIVLFVAYPNCKQSLKRRPKSLFTEFDELGVELETIASQCKLQACEAVLAHVCESMILSTSGQGKTLKTSLLDIDVVRRCWRFLQQSQLSLRQNWVRNKVLQQDGW